jgi:hypothetical protein
MEHTNAQYQTLLQKHLDEKKKQLIFIDEEVAEITAAVKRKLDYSLDSSDLTTEPN